MSQAFSSNKVTPVAVDDPRLSFTRTPDFGVIKSGKLITKNKFISQSSSTTGVNWNLVVPSTKTAVSRRIFVTHHFEVAINATPQSGGSGKVIDPSVYDAPRFAAGSLVTANTILQINGTSFPLNTYQIANVLAHANTSDHSYKSGYSMMPSMQDYYQKYSDAQAFTTSSGYGGAKDPLASDGENSYYTPRGGFPFTVVLNEAPGVGVAGNAIVRFDTTEPLWVSPTEAGDIEDHDALIGVLNMTLLINFVSNLQRVWSHSDNAKASVINTITVTLYQNSDLLLTYITPSDTEVIPNSVVYPYNNIVIYPTEVPALAGGASTTNTAQAIQFGTIPRRLFVWLQRNDLTATVTTTDTFARIDQINITWDNNAGILSSANTQMLYDASREAGLNMSWTQWYSRTGSIMIIDVNRLLLLNSSAEAPSLAISKSFVVTVTYTNLNNASITYTLRVAAVFDGLLTIQDGLALTQNSVLTPEDIVKAHASPVRAHVMSRDYYGGSFLSKIGRAARAANDVIKETNLVSTVADLTGHENISKGARALGYGGKNISAAELRAMRDLRY